MTRILLVEPDPVTARGLERFLTQANLNVYHCDDAVEALELVRLYDYDLVVSEAQVAPGCDRDGLEALRQARIKNIDTPWLVLSTLEDAESKIRGFGFGADDYMTKPFHRDELLARIYAIIRRSKGHSQSVIRTGRVSVDLKNKTVSVDDQPVYVTPREYQIMELLSLRKGVTLTKEIFIGHLYGGIDEPELKIIDVFIAKLRRKLPENTGDVIETVWGRGYRMRQE